MKTYHLPTQILPKTDTQVEIERLRRAAQAGLIGLAVLVIVVSMACRITGGGVVSPADATATFGAEQFHIQLTAQAAEGQNP